MKTLRFAVAAMLALACMAKAEEAPSARTAAREEAAIVLPFDPPLNEPLRYRIERTRVREVAGAVSQSTRAASEEELTFVARDKEGFVLRWRTLRSDLAGPAEQTLLAKRLIEAWQNTPVIVRLDPSGEPVAIDNWPEVQANLDRMIGELASAMAQANADRPQAERERGAKAMQTVRSMFVNMTPEQARQQLLKDISFLLGWGGTELRVGAPKAFRSTLQAEMIGAPLDVSGSSDLVAYAPGKSATVKVSSTTDPVTTKAAVQRFAERLLATASEADRSKFAAEFAKLEGLVIEEELTLTVALPSGVAESGSTKRQTGLPGGQRQVDTKVVTRLH